MAKSRRGIVPEGEVNRNLRKTKKLTLFSTETRDIRLCPYLWRIRVYLKGDLKVDEK